MKNYELSLLIVCLMFLFYGFFGGSMYVVYFAFGVILGSFVALCLQRTKIEKDLIKKKKQCLELRKMYNELQVSGGKDAIAC